MSALLQRGFKKKNQPFVMSFFCDVNPLSHALCDILLAATLQDPTNLNKEPMFQEASRQMTSNKGRSLSCSSLFNQGAEIPWIY